MAAAALSRTRFGGVGLESLLPLRFQDLARLGELAGNRSFAFSVAELLLADTGTKI
jgi:hypothetical protein